jgi:hypothetical protein
MDRETKMFLARILGETYRTQKRIDPKMCERDDAEIYGLINGIETAIDEEFGINDLDEVGHWIDRSKVAALAKTLREVEDDPAKLAAFKGYYDIEHEITGSGISRGEAMLVLKYFYAEGAYTEVIDKMDSSHSPSECRKFKLRSGDV